MTVALATDAYADVAMYRLSLDKQEEGAEEDIERDLAAISRWLDLKLGRFFGQEGPVTRSYPLCDGYPSTLDIDDLVSLDTAGIDTDGDGDVDQALTSSQYMLLPRNAALGSEPMPYRQIRLYPYGIGAGFTAGYDVVTGLGTVEAQLLVSGVWGWPAVPQAIIAATLQLTAVWRLDSPRATTQVTELGTALGTSRQAQAILNEVPSMYRKNWVLR